MTKKTEYLLLGAILLLGGILLFSNLDQYDIWGDETLTFPKGQSFGEVIEYTKHAGGTIHPPMYSLVQYFWMQGFAAFDLSKNRLIWAFFGLLSLVVTYFLGRELFNQKVALAGALLFTLSPFIVQYSRMVRYYTLTTLLTLLTIWFFARLKRTGKWSDWLLFTLSGTAFIYEDYLAVFILFSLYLYLLLNWKTYKKQIVKWILAVGVMFLLFLPWLPNIFLQTGGGLEPYPEHVEQFIEETPRMAQKAVGIRSIVVNSILKAGFSSYVFTVGETTYPWRFWITLPVLFSFLILFISAFKQSIRSKFAQMSTILVPFVFVFISTVIVSEIYGPFGSRMFQFPSKVMFLVPLLFLIVTAAWFSLKNRIILIISAVFILGGNVYGLSNFFSGEQFLNPKYLAPWRQVQMDIEGHATPNDLIITDEEAFLHNLHKTNPNFDDYGLVGALEKVERTLAERGPHLVYLLVRFRGDQTIYVEGLRVRDLLAESFYLVDTLNYLPSDPEAAPFWKKILGREPPEHLVQVFIFQIDQNTENDT